jgi:hypothetical protein
MWEGPGIRLTEVPADAYLHPRISIRSSDQPVSVVDPRTVVPAIVGTAPPAAP